MPWFCPTRGRPERLAELALSWEEHEPDTELFLRLWEGDPRVSEYLDRDWPEGWHFEVTDEEHVAEAMNGFFDRDSKGDFYGLITDDVVLQTPNGLRILENLARHWYVSYPNDLWWRHRLAGHMCCGGELLRTLGFWVPRVFKHNQIDVAITEIARECGLLRYCAEVVFHHRHFLYYKDVQKDPTYGLVYGEGINSIEDLKGWVDPSIEVFYRWGKEQFPLLVQKVRQALVREFEQ